MNFLSFLGEEVPAQRSKLVVNPAERREGSEVGRNRSGFNTKHSFSIFEGDGEIDIRTPVPIYRGTGAGQN